MLHKITFLLVVCFIIAPLSILGQRAHTPLAFPTDANNYKSEEVKRTFNKLKVDSLKEITFKYERTFGTNNDVVVGTMGSVAIDKYDRVFIGDTDQVTIHVFESTGEYMTSIGREGRGPCEFEYITPNTDIIFFGEKIYVTVDQLIFENSAHVFSLNDWSCSETIRLLSNHKDDFKELEGHYPIRFYKLEEDKLLVVYRLPYEDIPNKKIYFYYVLQDEEGTILSAPILRLPGPKYATYIVEGSYAYNAMHSFPFYSKSLFAMTKKGHLLTAGSENFEIRIHDLEANYLRSIKYPFENMTLNIEKMMDKYEQSGYMSRLGEGVVTEMLEDEENVPESWPALDEMFVDDKDRIWVSTIVDDEINE